MPKRSEFLAIVREVKDNHGVYIGTGNGELLESLTVADIAQMEKNYGDNPPKRTRQDFAFIGKCYENKYDMSKARVADCSGLVVFALREIGAIKKTSDYRARDFQKMCQPVDIQELVAGDLVFDKFSEATHVGIYVGDGNIIESRGRDYGTVETRISQRPFVVGGTFNWWEDEGFIITRNVKYVEGNLMKGDDIRELQKRLAELGLYTDTIDGIYGKNSAAAVVRYQHANGLTPDGIVGVKTATSLGFTFR